MQTTHKGTIMNEPKECYVPWKDYNELNKLYLREIAKNKGTPIRSFIFMNIYRIAFFYSAYVISNWVCLELGQITIWELATVALTYIKELPWK